MRHFISSYIAVHMTVGGLAIALGGFVLLFDRAEPRVPDAFTMLGILLGVIMFRMGLRALRT